MPIPASPAAAVATTLWIGSSVPAWRRFRRALADPRRAQARVLERIVRRGAGSDFGRTHRITVEGFHDQVPPRTYDELAPWIERVAAGEPDVLTTEPVTRLLPSSGSTAARKLVPSTAGLQAELQEAIGAWVVDTYRRRPGLLGGPSYWSITPALPTERSPGGLPIGFDDDTAYLGGLQQRLVEAATAVPASVARLAPEPFWIETATRLLAARELRLISVWNPSVLALLVDRIRDDWDELLTRLSPRRRRELVRPEPTAIWPRLGLVSCWADASASRGLPRLRHDFPGVPVQAKGLLATEAFVSIPWGDDHPAAITSHYLELEGDDGSLRPLVDAETGEEGSVVVTTSGGLWRYRLRDRIRVVGRVAATPSIRFVGKADRVSDLHGEKLSEPFVAGVLDRLGAGDRFALLAPESAPDRYVLYVVAPAPPAEALEAALRANPHYRWCVDVGQLAPAEVRAVPDDAGARHLEALRADGQRLGDIKPAALADVTGWGARLLDPTPRA